MIRGLTYKTAIPSDWWPMFCRYCGAKSTENGKFCRTCGKPVAVNNPVISLSNDPPARPESQRAGLEPDVSTVDLPIANEVARHRGNRNPKPLIIGISIALILGLAIGAASFYLLRVGSRPADSISTARTAAATVLPQSDQPLPSMPREVIDVSIDFDGTLLWNRSPVDRPTLQSYISHEASKTPQPGVHITVDKFAKYEIVAQTVADCQQRDLQVIVEQMQLDRPRASTLPTGIKPGDITITIDAGGYVYWNAQRLTSQDDLMTHLRVIAPQSPQPEVHIRGDANVRYQFVGQVLVATKKVGIRKVTASLDQTILVHKLMSGQVN